MRFEIARYQGRAQLKRVGSAERMSLEQSCGGPMQGLARVNLLPASPHGFQPAITFGDDFRRFAFSLPPCNGRNALQRRAPPSDNPLVFKATVTGCRRLPTKSAMIGEVSQEITISPHDVLPGPPPPDSF